MATSSGAATELTHLRPSNPMSAVASISAPSATEHAHTGTARPNTSANMSASDAPHTAVCTPNQPMVTMPTMSDTR